MNKKFLSQSRLFSFSVRLVALAVQKFISEIANDALQHCKIRSSNQLSKSKSKEKKYTLTMDDLAPALAEYGINVRKPQYYIGWKAWFGPKDYLFLIKILMYSYFLFLSHCYCIDHCNTDIEWRLTLINNEVLQGVALTLHLRWVDPYHSKFEYLVGINT